MSQDPSPHDKKRVSQLIKRWKKRAELTWPQVYSRLRYEDGSALDIDDDEFRHAYLDERPMRIDDDLALAVVRAFVERLTDQERSRAQEAIEFLKRTRVPLNHFRKVRNLFPGSEWLQGLRENYHDSMDLFMPLLVFPEASTLEAREKSSAFWRTYQTLTQTVLRVHVWRPDPENDGAATEHRTALSGWLELVGHVVTTAALDVDRADVIVVWTGDAPHAINQARAVCQLYRPDMPGRSGKLVVVMPSCHKLAPPAEIAALDGSYRPVHWCEEDASNVSKIAWDIVTLCDIRRRERAFTGRSTP